MESRHPNRSLGVWCLPYSTVQDESWTKHLHIYIYIYNVRTSEGNKHPFVCLPCWGQLPQGCPAGKCWLFRLEIDIPWYTCLEQEKSLLNSIEADTKRCHTSPMTFVPTPTALNTKNIKDPENGYCAHASVWITCPKQKPSCLRTTKDFFRLSPHWPNNLSKVASRWGIVMELWRCSSQWPSGRVWGRYWALKQ